MEFDDSHVGMLDRSFYTGKRSVHSSKIHDFKGVNLLSISVDYIFVPNLRHCAENAPSADTTNHLRALRIRSGQRIGAIDGNGGVGVVEVQWGNTKNSHPKLFLHQFVIQPRLPETTICMGLLDSRDRFEFAIEKLCELGIWNIQPLITTNGGRMPKPHSIDRWKQKCVAACTQSGNAWMPLLRQACKVEDVPNGNDAVHVVADTTGTSPSASRGVIRQQHVVVWVGPEGGFTQQERTHIGEHNNVAAWNLGTKRLRAETAAVVCVGILNELRQQE
jgi:16S rRNA (uracil1498-N3)-methyltransferase